MRPGLVDARRACRCGAADRRTPDPASPAPTITTRGFASPAARAEVGGKPRRHPAAASPDVTSSSRRVEHHRSTGGADQLRRAHPEHLQPEVVVLLGLADPLHAEALGEPDGAVVADPGHGEQLVRGTLEAPAGDRVCGLGGIAVAPVLGRELPGEFEVLAAGRHPAKRHRPDQDAVLAPPHRPVADRRLVLGVDLGPTLDRCEHGALVGDRIHGRAEPASNLGAAEDRQSGGGIVGVPGARSRRRVLRTTSVGIRDSWPDRCDSQQINDRSVSFLPAPANSSRGGRLPQAG